MTIIDLVLLPKYLKIRFILALQSWLSSFKLFVYCQKNGCNISHKSNITGDFSRLIVGKGTVINSYANLRFKQGNITIGQGCLFGQNVTILANTYDIQDNLPISSKRMFAKDVIIGDFVWVGTNAVILPGVSIGSNAIIGSSAVVTHNVPEGEVWGGIPARFIK